MTFLDYLYHKAYKIVGNNEKLHRSLNRITVGLWRKRDLLLRDITKYIPAGSIIYDIGGYIGVYTLEILSKVKDCKVYTFEPNPATFVVLKRNLDVMHFNGRVKLFNLAVSSYSGTRDFFVADESARSSLFAFQAQYKTEIKNTVKVNCVTLDSMINDNRLPDVIKIDAEGAECDILKGASDLLELKHPQLFIEPHSLKRIFI
jgi:FkbM family methyltransferase